MEGAHNTPLLVLYGSNMGELHMVRLCLGLFEGALQPPTFQGLVSCCVVVRSAYCLSLAVTFTVSSTFNSPSNNYQQQAPVRSWQARLQPRQQQQASRQGSQTSTPACALQQQVVMCCLRVALLWW